MKISTILVVAAGGIVLWKVILPAFGRIVGRAAAKGAINSLLEPGDSGEPLGKKVVDYTEILWGGSP